MGFVEFVCRRNVLDLFPFAPQSLTNGVYVHMSRTNGPQKSKCIVKKRKPFQCILWLRVATVPPFEVEAHHQQDPVLLAFSRLPTGDVASVTACWALPLQILAAEEFLGHANKTMVAYGLCATSERGGTADISRQKGSQDNDPTCVWSNSRCMAGTRVSAPKAKCCWGWDVVYSISRIDSVIQFCFTSGQDHKNKWAWV